MSRHQYTLADLATLLDVSYVGDAETVIFGLATLANASAGQLSFLANAKYQKDLENTSAAAVIVAADKVDLCPTNCLVSSNPYLTYAYASQLFAEDVGGNQGIHLTAAIGDNTLIADSASIGANVTIGDGVTIGANSNIGAGCVIGHQSVVGEGCILHANVTVYHRTQMGDRVTIHSGAVIGADGFGYAPSPDKVQGGWVKIAQLGAVRIGNDVEIGAGTTIDRGALDDTIIGDRVILDNMVQIAHNAEIGDNTAMAGCSGVAGSTRVGKNCTVGGGAGIGGHLSIADNVNITAMSLIIKSIPEAGSYSSGTTMSDSKSWRKNAVRFSQLDDMARRLSALEKSNT